MRTLDTGKTTDTPSSSAAAEHDPLVRLEAAFKLRMLELSGESTGADPYNRVRDLRQDAWGKGRPR